MGKTLKSNIILLSLALLHALSEFSISFQVCIIIWKKSFNSAVSPLRIDAIEKQDNCPGSTEALYLPIESSSTHFNAVIHNAAENASTTIHTQVLNDAYLSIPPIQSLCRAGFDAELTFKPLTRSLVDAYASLFKELFHV